MNWETVRLIWRQEIRVLLRSRRTIVLSIVLPMLVMPIMLFATRFTAERRDRQVEETLYRYAITGDWAAEARALLAEADQGLADDTESDLTEFLPSHQRDPFLPERHGQRSCGPGMVRAG